jgi:hypothetical protein
MDILSVIVGFVSTVISAVLIFVLQSQIKENRELRKAREKQEAIRETALENGVRQLLSVRLEEMYDKYADEDTIPRRAYGRWMKLHRAYKDLNGNGTFDHMNQEMLNKHIA